MGILLKKKATILIIISTALIDLFDIHNNVVHALNVGIQSSSAAGNPVTISAVGGKLRPACSRKCESEFCTVPPFLRYGKYCGLLYSGCPGEKPCDDLDACCMQHDACVQDKKNGYLSQECSKKLVRCMAVLKKRSSKQMIKTFRGNKCHTKQVVHVLSSVMKAALLAGRYLHKP